MKKCSICLQELDISNFYKDSKSKDGLHAYCKKCSWETTKSWREKNREKSLKQQAEYYQKNKEILHQKRKERESQNPNRIKSMRKKWQRKYSLKRYGLSEQDFESMFKNQNFKCAICKVVLNKDNAKIDHNHKTNIVRGILCNTCNVSLGHLEKSFIDKNLLKNAMAYWATKRSEK